MDEKEEKFEELDKETAGITDIADILGVLCNGDNLEEYAGKLYILINLLKQKCLKLNYLHCELRYTYMTENAEIYT